MQTAFDPTCPADGPARLRIAMLTGVAMDDPAAQSAAVHLDRLVFQLTRMGHSVDLADRRAGAGAEADDVAGEAGAAPSRTPGSTLAASRMVGQARHAPLGPRGKAPGDCAQSQGADFDIVHALSLRAGETALRLQQASGIPFVLAMETLGAPPSWPRAPHGAHAPVLHAAARILSPGTQHSRQLECLYRIAAARVVPAPRGFAPEELWPQPMAEARASLGLAQERFLVLYLGRVAPRKGIDTLIQGVSLLRRRHAVDAGLLIVGGGPGEWVELARLGHLASELGIGAHVQFAGPQPRASLRAFYAAADVCAATPWYEPFGMALIEAMACARPVIASELGDIGALVDDGGSGFLIPSRDANALADRLARLHRHPGLARAMGEAGRRRACEHHTWRSQATQLLALYRAALCELRQPAHPLTS